MTPAAEQAPWVKREIGHAELTKRPILPVLLEGEPFFRLSEIQVERVADSCLPSAAFTALVRVAGTIPALKYSNTLPSFWVASWWLWRYP